MERLTVGQVCAELQVTHPVVMALIRSGDLQAARAPDQAGRPFLVERAALEAWLDDQRAATRRFIEESPRAWNGMWDRETGMAPSTD